ncbi:hypothetical protein AMELA_G00259880 [Ameiurus melas]|uniref:Uncharacterized protein n=1 Tax=Ameiurus melas TaxID=219545 RepID=A0A7J5ZNT5_AMEME|nr:hypothetical protein AMELA_G00259880 [Ameiurus melas]
MPCRQKGELVVGAVTNSHPPSPIMMPAQQPCSADDAAQQPCSAEDDAQHPCSAEDVARPSCLAEVVARPPRLAEVVARPPRPAEDVTRHSCSAEVVAPPSCFAGEVTLPPFSAEDVAPYVGPPSCSTEDTINGLRCTYGRQSLGVKRLGDVLGQQFRSNAAGVQAIRTKQPSRFQSS